MEVARPSVLFVHGAFSRGAHFGAWHDRFERAGYACFAPTLPGHQTTDSRTLSGLSLSDYMRTLNEYRSGLPASLVRVGHSMGGLLAQRLAASGPSAGHVCIASAPPGMLTVQGRALRHLAPLMPRILAGRPIQPSTATFRDVALHDLAAEEQEELAADLDPESGKAYRVMIMGLFRVPRSAVRCPVLCVSGGADRIISRGMAASLARRYRAEHQIHAERGHWLIAPSAVAAVAEPVVQWVARNCTRA